MIPGNWQHVSLATLAALIILGAAIAFRPRRRNRRVRTVRPLPVVDYSAQYREKVAFLGSKFLLAQPINRRMAR